MTQREPKIGESPKFKNPPVVEVVMGVQFDPLDKMKAVHLGEFFSAWKADYPAATDMPPIPPATEVFGDEVAGRRTLQISFGQPQAQIPRQWFEDANGNLVQIQDDRFVVNWRKVEGQKYPSYKKICPSFFKHYDKFKQHCEIMELGEISPDLMELTYVNHIVPHQDFWSDHGLIDEVFSHWEYDPSDTIVLKKPSRVKWEMVFDVPDSKTRLRITCTPVTHKETGEHALRIELLARGVAEKWTEAGMKRWFDVAHHWIVWGFVDITSPVMQDKVWLRTKEDE